MQVVFCIIVKDDKQVNNCVSLLKKTRFSLFYFVYECKYYVVQKIVKAWQQSVARDFITMTR
jgi:hypothetical protein